MMEISLTNKYNQDIIISEVNNPSLKLENCKEHVRDNILLNKKINRTESSNKDTLYENIKLIFEKEKKINKNAEITKKLAFDCEMVEINKLGNGLARISVVNEHGDVIINTFCKPPGQISDYRYEITGLTSDDLENAMEYEECRKIILQLFKNKILIGHSIDNDFFVLNYEHSKFLIRDTSRFKYYRNKINQAFSLKYLSEKFLNKLIQSDTHDSIEDARAALCLYKLYEEEFEKEIMNKNHKLIRKKVLQDAKKMENLFGTNLKK